MGILHLGEHRIHHPITIRYQLPSKFLSLNPARVKRLGDGALAFTHHTFLVDPNPKQLVTKSRNWNACFPDSWSLTSTTHVNDSHFYQVVYFDSCRSAAWHIVRRVLSRGLLNSGLKDQGHSSLSGYWPTPQRPSLIFSADALHLIPGKRRRFSLLAAQISRKLEETSAVRVAW